MKLQYHQRTFDLIGQTPLLANDNRIEKKIQQFEAKYNLTIPEAVKEMYCIKNRKMTLYQFIRIYSDVNKLGVLYHCCFDDLIPTTETNLYFEKEYREMRLLHLIQSGNEEVYIHCQDLDDPVVYVGEYDVFFGSFIWNKSEHIFSEFVYLDIWDNMVAGNGTPKRFKVGWRFEMRGLNFSKEVREAFQQYFSELTPTLGIYYKRKFYRFQKEENQFASIFDDNETSYFHFYATDEENLVNLFEFLKSLSVFKKQLISFRKGDRNKRANTNSVSPKIWKLVKDIMSDYEWK